MTEQLFAGLKVIDCASFIAAPAAATVLSDFGADVIKIEPPGEGDAYRTLHAVPGTPKSNVDYAWLHGARNKRSIALNLKTPQGLEVLHRLVAKADVFVTNLPLPVRRRMMISYEDLSSRNAQLIYASFTAYGEKGVEADKTGFDSTAYWARSGLMDQVRPDSMSPPARSVAGMGDHPCSIALYAAIVTGLYRRQLTGKGGLVSSSLLANGLWSNAFLVQARLTGATIPPRPPRSQSLSATTNMYRTRDNRWFNLAMVNDVKQYPLLVATLGRPELAADPRFATADARRANVPALMAEFDDLFARFDLADLRTTLDAAGITFGFVGTIDEALDDQQMRDAGAIVPLADGSFETISSPFHVEGAPKTPPRQAPGVGEHSDDVLREYGYSAEEISRMRAAKAVA
ncbi:CoA transferase [Bradyrhizobium sp. LHD-71]|uniref:CaiB/BaiF CoA transferase family protein n=1 Tax=Bradyrhizobium sp. LHD-71 TaxID=3072141 RepID=UPI00280E6432|nr:CoA transferase [Bradyrhizobium sp. LHD-71]MDQ8730286.1 CoA transferase [Bradyrhizobium sp. LHD-71]